MIEATEVECTSGNVWNHQNPWVNTTADTPEKCAALGATYVYVAREVYAQNNDGTYYPNNAGRATLPGGCVNTGTECKDFAYDWANNNGCSSWGGSSTPCECVQTYFDFVSPGDCTPGQSCEEDGQGGGEHNRVNSYQLKTTYRADSPVVQKCKLESFWSCPDPFSLFSWPRALGSTGEMQLVVWFTSAAL